MMFKIISNDVTGVAESISIFNSTLNTMKRNIKSGQGIIYSIFNGDKLTKNDIQCITSYASSLKDGLEPSESFKQNMMGCSVAAKKYVVNARKARQSADELTAGLKTTTAAAKANTIVMKGLAIAGNVLASIGLSIVISKAISFIHDMVTANEQLLESAKELSSEFKKTESSINDYKDKIEELHKTINDNSSSINDVTQARKDLMVIQDELIKKFGTEKDTIDIVTKAINGQADALDYLSQKKYQEWKNEFNDKSFGQMASDFFSSDNISNALLKITEFDFQGAWDSLTAPTESNTDKMVNSMQHAYYEIDKTGNQTLDDLISKTYGLLDLGDKFRISGNLNDIYEDLLEIQNMSNNFDVSDRFESSITNTANAMDETLKSFKDAYNTYILYEKILDGSENTGYDKQLDQINKAKEAYNDAVSSGNEDSIKQAGNKYAKTLQSAISSAIKNSDNDVANYFKSIYPEMQQIFGEWKFELNFEPNTDELQTKVLDALDKIDGESNGAVSFSTEDILNFNPTIATQEQIYAYGELKRVAEEYGLTVENLIGLLQKMGLIIPENYQQLVDTFGQKLVDTLSDEDLQFAFSVSTDSINSWDEFIEKINKAKEEAFKESQITNITDIIGKLGEDAIDDYQNNIASLQSYLDKFSSGDYSSTDMLSLTDDFGITGDSVEELTKKIGKLMDKELDSIIEQIDEIINGENLTEDTQKALERLKQSLIGVNKEAQNLAGFTLTGNVLADVQNLSEGLDQLDKIYADILDKEEFDWSSILNNEGFTKAFGAYTEEYENFINTIASSPSDINACQESFDQLAAAYIKGSGVLNEVTVATKAATIAMLEQMGVSNAAAIVEQALTENERMLEAQKYATANGCLSLADATYTEITALIAEGKASAEVQKYLAKLAIEKWGVENTKITTQEDCNNLLNLARYAGATAEQIRNLKSAMQNLNITESTNLIGSTLNSAVSNFIEKSAKKMPSLKNSIFYKNIKKDKKAQKAVQDAMDDIANNLNAKLEIPEFKVNYTGGTTTKDTIDKLQQEREKEQKEAEKAKEKVEETAEQFDWIATLLDNLTDAASKARDKIDDMLSFGAKKKQTQKAIEETTKAIEVQYKAMQKYSAYADKFSVDAAKETTDIVTENVANTVSNVISDATSDIVSEAMKYVNVLPYVFGGTSLTSGADCSGFVQQIYKKFGIDIPRVSMDQYSDPNSISISHENLQPGDLVFFKGSSGKYNGEAGHVGIYAGNGQFIDAPTSGKKVQITSLSNRSDYIGAKRYPGTPSASVLYNDSVSTTSKTYTKTIPGVDNKTLAHYQKLVRQGSFDIDTITNEKLKNAIKSYQEWWEKVQSCKDEIDNLNKTLKELYQTMAEIPIEKREKKTGTIDSRIELLESTRENVSDIIVNKKKFRSTNKEVKKSRKAVKKNIRIKKQKNASGLTKKEIKSLNSYIKSKKSIPDKLLDSIDDSTLYDKCKAYNDAVSNHSLYEKTGLTVRQSINKFNSLTNKIISKINAKTKQYKAAYNSVSKDYSKSLTKVSSAGRKVKKILNAKNTGLEKSTIKKIKSCVRSKKEIPSELLAQYDQNSSFVQMCIAYNRTIQQMNAEKEVLKDVKIDWQKQKQDSIQQKREKKIEKRQNRADKIQEKIDKNDALAENETLPKEKNKYLKENLSLLNKYYKQMIAIAKLEGNSVKAEKLKAEWIKAVRDNEIEQHQNNADFAQSKIDRNNALMENEILPDKKNQYIKKNISLTDTYYKHMIKIAELEKNSVEAEMLKAEWAKARIDLQAEQYQNNADYADGKIERNNSLIENKTSAKDKNEYLKNNNLLLKEQYKWLIKIAELRGDTVEMQKLQAELEKKLNDNTKQTYQNLADERADNIEYYQQLAEISISAKDKNKYESKSQDEMKWQYLNLQNAAFDDPQEHERLGAELQSKLNESYKTMFDNVRTEYEQMISLIDNDIADLDDEIKKTEASGRLVDASFYQYKISMQDETLDRLKEEESKLRDQIVNVKMYSSEWYDTQDAIQSVQDAQAEALATIKEYKDAITDIANTIQNDIVSAFHDINDEADLLITLLGDDLSDPDIGSLTDDGLAVLSLYVSQLNITKESAESLHDTINSLQDAADKSTLSFIDANGIQRDYASIYELKEDIKDLYSTYQDEIKNTYDHESNIVDLMKQKYQAELDYLKDLIEKKKEALNAEKELYEYSKNIKEQIDDINSLRKQISALRGDSSIETNARVQKLQSQLKEAEASLNDTEYDRYISDQQDMLDNLYEEYSKLLTDLEKDREKLLQEGLDLFAQTGSEVQDTIRVVAEEYSYEITSEMNGIITSIENMGSLATYFEADGIVTRSLDNISLEIQKVYTTLSAEIEKGLSALSINGSGEIEKDSTNNTGHSGDYDVYTGETDHSTGIIFEDIDELRKKAISEYMDKKDISDEMRALADKAVAEYMDRKTGAVEDKVASTTNQAASSSEKLSSALGSTLNSPAAGVLAGNARKTLITNLLRNGSGKYQGDDASALNKYVHKNYGNALSVDQMSLLSKYLGLNYSTDDLAKDNPNKKKYKNAILNALKLQGFSKGGIVKDLEDAIRLNGDKVLVSADPGEGFLNKKQTELLQSYMKNSERIATNRSDPALVPWDKIGVKTPNYEVDSKDSGTNYQFGDMTFNVTEAANINDLLKGIQKSHEFERMFGSMVETKLTGRNKLSKYNVRF